MANYRNDFADVNLETGAICRNFMNHTIGSGDTLGDRFGVRVFRNGEPVSLGGTCAGYFVRNTTGETVVISSGVVSGNEAYVTLPAACYAVEGSFTLAIKVTSGSETVTMRIIDGVVSRTNTSVTVDPGTLVPSIETLISAINSAVGQIPVNYNASFAPAYSESSTYAVGDYVVYDGYLWRCTTAITETETWTAAHWTKVALASDVSDLKSALNWAESDINGISNVLELYAKGKSAISASYTVANRYITVLGELKSAGLDSFTVSWYPVVAEKKYLISGTAKLLGSGQSLICFDDEYNSNTAHFCKDVIQEGTTTLTQYNIEYKANTNGYLLMPSISTVELTVYEVLSQDSERLENIESDIINVITRHENYLDGMAITDNTIYNPSNAERISNNNGKTYPYIRVQSGKTYYFKNLYAYFCVVKYDGVGTIETLSASTDEDVDGTFTASYDGILGITISKNVSAGYLFTDDIELYNNTGVETYYTVKADNIRKTYKIEKDGTGDFTSLVEGLEEACKYMDSVVYVGDGTWDIVDELGTTYIENVSANNPGIILKNRVHVIFSSKALVKCEYDGTRTDTIRNLSAFNAGKYGFTLENANIKTKNCRYCVHDERGTNADSYTNKYLNCIMVQDNTQVEGATVQGFAQCIGGGLGASGHILISGCLFKNVNPVYENAWCELVTYHNTSALYGRSIVEIVGNYLVGRYSIIRGSWNGTTTDKTQFLVHDNSLGYAIRHQAENASATVENTEMYKWNNEIRNS